MLDDIRSDRSTLREELSFETSGGDDVHEPGLGDTENVSPPPASEKKRDPNMVDWDGPDDLSNPQNWSNKYKWMITLVCSLLTINVTFASSAPTAATQAFMKEFKVTTEVSYLITTTFLLGYVFGPLFWGPGSELIGRRKIFIISMTAYSLSHLGQAFAQNIETLLVTRFFSGFFAVAPMTNCGGVNADIWSAAGRGPATSLFTASVFLGPVIGPIVGGYVIQSPLGWRWVFWIMMTSAGFSTLVMLVLLPETYAPIILQKKAQLLRKLAREKYKDIYAQHEKQDWSIRGVLHRTIYRPVHMLATEPILALVTVYLSVVSGLLYALFEAFPIIFIKKRGFSIAQDGLVFIGVGIGTTIGSFLNYLFTAHYPALIKKWKGFPPPEERLIGAMVGGPCLFVAIFWLGWTGEYVNIPWYVPASSTVLFGMSISLIFISFLSYLVDTYLKYSASAYSANTIIRSATAAVFPLFIAQMFTKLGVNWASTLLGIVALILSPSPFLFYKYGSRIRAGSKFAPCVDLRIAKELAVEGGKAV